MERVLVLVLVLSIFLGNLGQRLFIHPIKFCSLVENSSIVRVVP